PLLQPAADRRVAAGDDFLAGPHAIADLDVRGVGDAGLHAAHVHDVAGPDEDDALQLLARLARLPLLHLLVRDVGAVIALVAGRLFRGLLLTLLWRESAVGGAHGHALDGHGHGVLHRIRLDVRRGAHSRP